MSRPIRQTRSRTNENDENANAINLRLNREKTKANGTTGLLISDDNNNKNKLTGTNTAGDGVNEINGGVGSRRRPALGDLSNVAKKDINNNLGLKGTVVSRTSSNVTVTGLTNTTTTRRPLTRSSTTNISTTNIARNSLRGTILSSSNKSKAVKPSLSTSSLSSSSTLNTSSLLRSNRQNSVPIGAGLSSISQLSTTSTLTSKSNNNNNNAPTSRIARGMNEGRAVSDRLRPVKNTHGLEEITINESSRASKRPKLDSVVASSELENGNNTQRVSLVSSSSITSALVVSSASDNVSAPSQRRTTNSSTSTNPDNVVATPLIPSHQSDTAATVSTISEVQDWDDLDAEDEDDPLMVSEYVVEIFDFLYGLEESYLPYPLYVNRQSYFNWNMRGVLIDWLVEVHCRFRLLPETLFLAVNLIDRYLSVNDTELSKIQLIGISCLFIAAKYEEVFTPAVSNFAYLADGYQDQEILDAERDILEVLQFRLSYPNPMNFLRRISKADDYDIQTRTIGKYLLEISLFDHRLLEFRPSVHSAAAMFLAREILNRPPWDTNLKHYSGGYDEASLRTVLSVIVDYLISPVAHEAFFKKYASKRFLKASIIARTWAKENKSRYPLRSRQS